MAALAVGWHHTCALTTAGGVKCWGENGDSQLGDGTTTSRSTPVDVSGLTSGMVALTTGVAHTCALMASGRVKCWGWNPWGQLGDGTTNDHSTPVDVSSLGNVAALSAGNLHTCALTTVGGVWCWGYNRDGQLGDGTIYDHSTPVEVSGLGSGLAGLAAGYDHTCALTVGGGVKCWGYNQDSQLGDGTNTDRSSPVDVNGLSRGTVALAAGGSHTCAVMADGHLKCWGNDWGSSSCFSARRMRILATT